mmetsp:Transcript_13931/g.13929  ORF Transcript_13931/g.13929 Transcript_13931/m.13929 type:complete len:357 (-) Transcript_13931:28-1098(-)
MIHTAVMTHIQSDCKYEYRVGSGLFWSEMFKFNGRTPEDGNNTLASFIVYGDLGTGPYAEYTRVALKDELKNNEYLAMIHLGDFAYDMEDREGRIGDLFMNNIEPYAANYPYMTTTGNHEKFKNLTHYKDRFIMPWNEASKNSSYFYSLNIGPLHMIFLNTYAYFKEEFINEALTQTNWLIEDLKEANKNRSLRPWIVILGHHPLYCSVDWRFPTYPENVDCQIDAPMLQTHLEDLAYTNGVDLFLTAHVHNYERDAAIYKNETIPSEVDTQSMHYNPNAPIYIVTGNAGNRRARNDPTSKTPQYWARYLSDDYGYGRFKAYNETHIYYEQYSAENKKTVDSVWIIKNRLSYAPLD